MLSSKVLSKSYWNAFHGNTKNTKSPEKMWAKKEHALNNEISTEPKFSYYRSWLKLFTTQKLIPG